ncbi:MAG TPA: hypothetical protein H9759_09055 [Candidatus Dietzia intestinipullorum]|nr:hypothetical protein [Candidatus Dietzia intestinipullorum]
MSQNILTALIALVLFLGVLALMAWGWRNRQRSQAHLFDGLPAVPESPGEPVLGPLTGVYVGSTVAGDWQARIVRPPLGHRSAGSLTAHTTGLRLELADATVWIPRADLVDVRRASALANKTVPGGGLVVARWRLRSADGGTTVVDTGFRADDKDTYDRWEQLRGDAADPDPTHDPPSTQPPHAPRSTNEENQ